MMKIGAQLYTVRAFTQTVEGIDETFRKVAEIGYKTVQCSAMGAIAPEKLREIAEKYGLEIGITHYAFERIRDNTEEVIAEHKAFGCKNIGVGYMPDAYQDMGMEGYRKFIREFAPAAQKIKENGMTLSYHNHDFEFEKFNGEYPYDVLANEMPDLNFIPDVYWVQMGGRTPAQLIEKLAGRIKVCHLKDLTIRGKKQAMAPVMEGNLDFASILAACEKAGVEYGMVEQDNTYDLDPFEALRISYENLKKAGYR